MKIKRIVIDGKLYKIHLKNYNLLTDLNDKGEISWIEYLDRLKWNAIFICDIDVLNY